MAACSSEEFNFKYLEQNLKCLELPSKMWCSLNKKDEFVAFLKIRNDFTASLKIIIRNNLQVDVFVDEEHINWLYFNEPQSVNDISSILKTVDKIQFSLN